jgi:hypothetical protein
LHCTAEADTHSIASSFITTLPLASMTRFMALSVHVPFVIPHKNTVELTVPAVLARGRQFVPAS